MYAKSKVVLGWEVPFVDLLRLIATDVHAKLGSGDSGNGVKTRSRKNLSYGMHA